jgi:oligopeptide/dipeptide ABC transporter ATP-binding protein
VSEALIVTPVDPPTRPTTHVDVDPDDVVLEVVDLHTEFGSVHDPIRAVRGASFQLQPGRTLVLLGESGSGKSVMARSVLRLYGSNARIRGAVRLGEVDLGAANERTLRSVRGQRIALVPQDPSGALDPLRSVGSQIVEVLREHDAVASKAEGRDRAVELLRLVGIPDPGRIVKAFPHELSGGMRQRVVIAIAVSCNPQVLIADEPTTALDVTVQAQILELFQSLQQSLHMAMLLVTHDVGVAREVGDEVAVMYAGRIVEHGPASEVLDSPSHPYTAALLASVPTPGVERGALAPIPGRAVLAGEPIKGCPFAPRCPRCVTASWTDEPDLVRIMPGRVVACHNPIRAEEAVAS